MGLNKTKRINLSLNETDWNLLTDLSKKSGKNKPTVLRDILETASVKSNSQSDQHFIKLLEANLTLTQQLTNAMNAVGSNINQVARAVNVKSKNKSLKINHNDAESLVKVNTFLGKMKEVASSNSELSEALSEALRHGN